MIGVRFVYILDQQNMSLFVAHEKRFCCMWMWYSLSFSCKSC